MDVTETQGAKDMAADYFASMGLHGDAEAARNQNRFRLTVQAFAAAEARGHARHEAERAALGAEVVALTTDVDRLKEHLTIALDALATEGCCDDDCISCGIARKLAERPAEPKRVREADEQQEDG